jgi:hypothetical protein
MPVSGSVTAAYSSVLDRALSDAVILRSSPCSRRPAPDHRVDEEDSANDGQACENGARQKLVVEHAECCRRSGLQMGIQHAEGRPAEKAGQPDQDDQEKEKQFRLMESHGPVEQIPTSRRAYLKIVFGGLTRHVQLTSLAFFPPSPVAAELVAEPGRLPLGVLAGGGHRQCHRLVDTCFAGERIADLADPDRLHGRK